MRSPRELPPALQGGPFDVASARSLGVSDERLRRRDLRRPFHGVRVPAATALHGGPLTEAEKWAVRLASAQARARDYAARMPADQFFSHATAALLHGLPVPAHFLDRTTVDVATDVKTRRRAGRNVRGHLVPESPVTVVEVDGMRVASVVDTWRQLSTMLTIEELVVVGDFLVRRQNPPATLEELELAVTRQAGRPGVRRLREAHALVRPRTDSARETELRLVIVFAGLPEPEVNVPLVNRYGAFMALGDLVYVRYRILIEYDGGVHREDEKQFHRDIDRLDEPMEEGWRVIRVNNSHLGVRKHALVARIRRALIERGWTPPA